MTDIQTIDAIHAHLDTNPTDWQARRELADLYEDAGQHDEARTQRWMVEHRVCPIISNERGAARWKWQHYGHLGRVQLPRVGGSLAIYGLWLYRESAESWLQCKLNEEPAPPDVL